MLPLLTLPAFEAGRGGGVLVGCGSRPYLTMYHFSIMKATIKNFGGIYKVVFHRFSVGGVIPSSSDKAKSCGSGSAIVKEDNNLCRAKSKIREYALCNDWSHFVTLTIAPDRQNRYDIDGYVKALGAWIGNYNRKYGCKLKYLLIPEQHKDGAWHMHGLFSGVAPDSVCVNEYGYLDMPYYAQRFGFISLSAIRDKTKCAAYITKYVSKAVGSTAIAVCKHSYYHSQGLNVAEEVGEVDVRQIPEGVWTNDYCGVAWCNDEESLAELLDKSGSVF